METDSEGEWADTSFGMGKEEREPLVSVPTEFQEGWRLGLGVCAKAEVCVWAVGCETMESLKVG